MTWFRCPSSIDYSLGRIYLGPRLASRAGLPNFKNRTHLSPRILPLLLASAAIAYACGPRGHASESPARQQSRATAKGLEASLKVSIDSAADQIRLALRLTNSDPRHLELRFPNGQTHDFVVLDTTGREIWKWSEGRLFTQSMQSRVLDRNESVTYAADWDPGSLQGTYVAVVSLRSENHPVEQSVRFEIP